MSVFRFITICISLIPQCKNIEKAKVSPMAHFICHFSILSSFLITAMLLYFVVCKKFSPTNMF